MEIILAALLTLFATFGAAGMVIYYLESRYEPRLQQQLLVAKRLEVVSQMLAIIGRIKANLEYPNDEETLRQWKQRLVTQLQNMRSEAYQWEFFLPPEVRQLPYQYIKQVSECLYKLDGVNADELYVAVEIMNEVKQVESAASQRLQQQLLQSMTNSSIKTLA